MTRLTAACLALLALLAAPPAAAADEAAARALTTTLIDRSHAALTGEGLSDEARMTGLKAAVAESFAFDVWERFLLGDRTGEFDAAQLAEFRALLPGFITKLFADQFVQAERQKPVIGETRPVRSDVLVRAKVERANGRVLPVDWRVREFEGRGPLVIDMMVGGTSFLVLKRDEFNGLLDKGGPAMLLDFMRKHTV